MNLQVNLKAPTKSFSYFRWGSSLSLWSVPAAEKELRVLDFNPKPP